MLMQTRAGKSDFLKSVQNMSFYSMFDRNFLNRNFSQIFKKIPYVLVNMLLIVSPKIVTWMQKKLNYLAISRCGIYYYLTLVSPMSVPKTYPPQRLYSWSLLF